MSATPAIATAPPATASGAGGPVGEWTPRRARRRAGGARDAVRELLGS